jgi:hypothetical protein
LVAGPRWVPDTRTGFDFDFDFDFESKLVSKIDSLLVREDAPQR